MNYTLFLQGPLDLFLKQVLFAVFKLRRKYRAPPYKKGFLNLAAIKSLGFYFNSNFTVTSARTGITPAGAAPFAPFI